MIRFAIATLCLACSQLGLSAAEPVPLLGADFASQQELQAWQGPKDWHRERYAWQQAEGVDFVRVQQQPAQLSRSIDLPAGVGELLLAMRYRADGLVTGEKGWETCWVTAEFRDAAGLALNTPWETVVKVQPQPSWTVASRRLPVPQGAAVCSLMLSYKAKSGAVDIDWIRLYDAAKAPAELLAQAPAQEEPAVEQLASDDGIEAGLMPQTSFAGTGEGIPAGWQPGEAWMAAGFKRHPRGFLLMDAIPQRDGHYVETTAPIDPSQVRMVRMHVDMNGRAHRLKDTEDIRERPRLELGFEDAQGAAVGEPLVIPITGFLTQNATQSIIGEVPSAARRLRLKAIYHGKGELTLRRLHVVPATGDEPAWMHRPAHIPAGANAPHPIGKAAPQFADPGELAREPGAAIDETRVQHRLQAAPGDDLQAVWQQLRAALDRGEGVELTLAAGDYRLDAPLLLTELSDAAREALLIIRGAGRERTRLSGAVSTGFEPAGWELVDAERRIYRHPWTHDWGFVSDGYYQPSHVITHRRELLFLDGQRLTPEIIEGTTFVDRKGRVYNSVGLIVEQQEGAKGGYSYTGFRGLEVLDPGEFAVAELGPSDQGFDGHAYPDSLLLRLPEGRSDLNGATIELAMTPELLRIEHKSNLVLRDLAFVGAASHYNNYRQTSAVSIDGYIDQDHDVLVERCAFSHNNGKGLGVGGIRNVTLREVEVADNGCFGIGFHHLYNAVAEDVDVLDNNWRGRLGDATIHSTGGMTWSGERVRFTRCRFNGNFGTGWRSDVWVIDVVAEDCEFNHNDGSGAGHEIGWGPVVHRRCQALGNGGSGVHLTNTRDVRFESCRIEGNGELAVELYAMPNRISRPSMIDRDMFFVHHNERVQLINCTLTAEGEGRLIGQKFGQGSVDNYHLTLQQHYQGSGNRFHHPSETAVFETTSDYRQRTWTDLAGWQAKTGQDQDASWAGGAGH